MQRRLAPSLAEILKETNRKMLEKEETVSEEVLEDLNILPMPMHQIVDKTMMVWVWNPIESVYVFGKLCTKPDGDLVPGDWAVELALPGVEGNCYQFADDAAKIIGQSLISAWNYKNIWKQHAGDFLERQLMSDDEPVEETVEESVDVVEILEDPEEVVEEFVKRDPIELSEFQKTYREPVVIEGEVDAVQTTPSFDNG